MAYLSRDLVSAAFALAGIAAFLAARYGAGVADGRESVPGPGSSRFGRLRLTDAFTGRMRHSWGGRRGAD